MSGIEVASPSCASSTTDKSSDTKNKDKPQFCLLVFLWYLVHKYQRDAKNKDTIQACFT